jgi:uncharacterized protein with ParB-like and HNH nuclease domain
MKASETKFQPIIEGTKQYVVPLFQRSYSWDKKEWDLLWEDIIDLCENEELKNHFIGSIVTMPTSSVPEGVSKYLLIDGQQRLTTIFIILTLLRNKARSQGKDDIATEIEHTMLVNPFKKGDDYFKLLPTQVDREAFKALVNNMPYSEEHGMFKCYKYFERKINQQDDIIKINKVLTSRFSVVSIVLDYDDNPHLVFESLNAKGRQLTQADLIRNYFFMRIHVDRQQEMYDLYWKPMEDGLGSGITEYIRHYMMREGNFVKQSDVYFTLKDRIERENTIEALSRLAKFAEYYKKMINPEWESNILIGRALQRLKRLDSTTVYPFLLNCYDDYSNEVITTDEFVEVIGIIENYLIRRYVCNLETNQYNKLFAQLYGWIKNSHYPSFTDGLRFELQKKDYPKDTFLKSRIMEVKLYGQGEKNARTKFILENLEMQFSHKERPSFDNLTIEHILPQTLNDWWRDHLGSDWQADHELCLHTLGNLTITAYNAELSNESFFKKKIRFSNSNLELNHYFENALRWDREAIEKRTEYMSDLVIKCWPYFGDEQAAFQATSADDATGKIPQKLSILGQQFVVKSWREVLIKTLNTISDLEPDLFRTIADNYSNYINQDPDRFAHNMQLNNGYYINVNLSSRTIYRICVQFMETIGISRNEWIVETTYNG